MKKAVILLTMITGGCFARVVPPQPPPIRPATQVDAGFAKTWDAVVDAFADRNIPIATMDRASGFIATSALIVGPNALTLADCGSVGGLPVYATSGTYNVVVRGDSTSSTVKVTAAFTAPDAQCSTKAVFENDTELAIKARAEGTYVAAASEVQRPPHLTPGGEASIVLPPDGEVIGYSDPSTESRVKLRFKGPVLVRVLQVRGDWVLVSFGSGRDDNGWVRTTELAAPK